MIKAIFSMIAAIILIAGAWYAQVGATHEEMQVQIYAIQEDQGSEYMLVTNGTERFALAYDQAFYIAHVEDMQPGSCLKIDRVTSGLPLLPVQSVAFQSFVPCP